MTRTSYSTCKPMHVGAHLSSRTPTRRETLLARAVPTLSLSGLLSSTREGLRSVCCRSAPTALRLQAVRQRTSGADTSLNTRIHASSSPTRSARYAEPPRRIAAPSNEGALSTRKDGTAPNWATSCAQATHKAGDFLCTRSVSVLWTVVHYASSLPTAADGSCPECQSVAHPRVPTPPIAAYSGPHLHPAAVGVCRGPALRGSLPTCSQSWRTMCCPEAEAFSSIPLFDVGGIIAGHGPCSWSSTSARHASGASDGRCCDWSSNGGCDEDSRTGCMSLKTLYRQ